MLLYIIYNLDLVDVTKKEERELTLTFVDDTTLVIVGKTFEETHRKLKDIMERQGGVYEWSANHNSHFETSKFKLIDFSLNRSRHHPDMILRGVTIKSSATHKFLGVILDNELCWKAHAAYTTAKGASYTILL